MIMYGVVLFLSCVWCIKLRYLGGATAATRVVSLITLRPVCDELSQTGRSVISER